MIHLQLFQPEATAGAMFDEYRTRRYYLWRIWEPAKPLVLFIGLNPSTADENQNDPTIRRVAGFAKSFGYGGFYMMNLFTHVTPYPSELQHCQQDFREDDIRLDSMAKKCADVVFAWGSFKTFGRDKQVMKMFPDALCLGKTAAGCPRHPLYLLKETQLIKFKQP